MAKVCPYCGSTRFIKHGTQVNTLDHSEHQRYRCKKKECLKFFTYPRYTGLRGAKIEGGEPVDAPDADE